MGCRVNAARSQGLSCKTKLAAIKHQPSFKVYTYFILKKVYSSLIIHNYWRGYTLREEAFCQGGRCAHYINNARKRGEKRKKNNKEPTQTKGKTPLTSSSITR